MDDRAKHEAVTEDGGSEFEPGPAPARALPRDDPRAFADPTVADVLHALHRPRLVPLEDVPAPAAAPEIAGVGAVVPSVADVLAALHASPTDANKSEPAPAVAATSSTPVPSVADVLGLLHAQPVAKETVRSDATMAKAHADVSPTPTPSVADVLAALHAERTPVAPPRGSVSLPLKERIPTVQPAVSAHGGLQSPTARAEGQSLRPRTIDPPAGGTRGPETRSEAAREVPTGQDFKARIIPFVPRVAPPVAPGTPLERERIFAKPEVPFFAQPAQPAPLRTPAPAQPPPPDGFRRPAPLEDAQGGGERIQGARIDMPAGHRLGRWAWRDVLGAVVKGLAILFVAYAAFVLALVVAYRWINPPLSNLMLAQRLTGTPITQVWVPLERISPSLQHAVILSEDGQFCRHRGVDWGELKEILEQSPEGPARGGSTITMQLVKNLFLWSSKSYVRKAIEIPLALLVEQVWPKARVLEIYLNIAEWGPGVFGAEAAARYHFHKSAAALSAREASLLAVSLPNPFDRQAGRPGVGTQRLANNLQSRMGRTASVASCGRSPKGGALGVSDRR